MTFFRTSIAILLAVSLGACSSSKFKGVDGFNFLRSMVQNKLAAKNPTPSENPLTTLTRSQLADFSGPLILAHLETNNAYSSLSVVGTNGSATTFLTPDQISLTFEHGVLIASRGLGGDLLSTDSAATLTALNGKGSTRYKRIYRSLDAEDHIIIESFECILQQTATETIEIMEKSYFTAAYLERCQNNTVEFLNSYWLSRKNSVIISSYQWISASVGSVKLWTLIE